MNFSLITHYFKGLDCDFIQREKKLIIAAKVLGFLAAGTSCFFIPIQPLALGTAAPFYFGSFRELLKTSYALPQDKKWARHTIAILTVASSGVIYNCTPLLLGVGSYVILNFFALQMVFNQRICCHRPSEYELVN